MLAEAPLLSVLVGDVVIVEDREIVVDPLSDPLGVCEAVGDAVLVLVPVVELVAVTDSLPVDVVESVPLLLLLIDGNAPIVTEEVGD